MGQLISSLSLAMSLRLPLALSFLLPWTAASARTVAHSRSDDDAEGSSSSVSSNPKEGWPGSSTRKRKASVSAGTSLTPTPTPNKRQATKPRRRVSLIHAQTIANDEEDMNTAALSSSPSSSASSDSEGASLSASPSLSGTSTPATSPASSPTIAPRRNHTRIRKLTPLPPPVPRARPIPNSYWATPFLLACEYPWCPRTASATGAERPPKLDALLKAGVRCFVDLTEPGELAPYHVEGPAGESKKSEMKAESKQTASVLLQRCAVLGIPAEEVSYHRFPIQDRSLPPIVPVSRSPSLSSPSPPSLSPVAPAVVVTPTSGKCPLISRALALLSANAAQGKITAVHCRGGIGRTGVVVGCFLVHSGYVSSRLHDVVEVDEDGDEDEDGNTPKEGHIEGDASEEDAAGENALRLIEREWKGVAKRTRYPQSPETGPQVEYVRHYRREGTFPMSSWMGAGVGGGAGKGLAVGTGTEREMAKAETSVAVKFAPASQNANGEVKMVTATTTTEIEPAVPATTSSAARVA